MINSLKLCVATSNQGKINEYKALLNIAGLVILTPKMLGVEQEASENGATFVENALIKAREMNKKTGLPALADDSGLCVKALGGAPGIFSARYGGELCTDDNQRCQLLLREMENISDRKAYFTCAIALALPDGTEKTFEGRLSGIIARQMRGNYGFGYDPIFYLPSIDRHIAELSLAEKDKLSHRAQAAKQVKKYLRNLMGQHDLP